MFELGGNKTFLCVDLDGTLIHLNGDWSGVHNLIKPYTNVLKASEEAVKRNDTNFFKELNKFELADLPTPLKLISFIRQLNPKIPKFMITNNTTATGDYVNRHFDLGFKEIIGIDQVTKGKPSPEGINKIISKYNLIPRDGYFIGNAKTDREAAEKAGLSFISAYLFNE